MSENPALSVEYRPGVRVSSVPVVHDGRWTIASTLSWELAVALAKAVLDMPKAST